MLWPTSTSGSRRSSLARRLHKSPRSLLAWASMAPSLSRPTDEELRLATSDSNPMGKDAPSTFLTMLNQRSFFMSFHSSLPVGTSVCTPERCMTVAATISEAELEAEMNVLRLMAATVRRGASRLSVAWAVATCLGESRLTSTLHQLRWTCFSTRRGVDSLSHWGPMSLRLRMSVSRGAVAAPNSALKWAPVASAGSEGRAAEYFTLSTH
mmetsp:Transcript_26209/g.73283  ORF Transcript_26209/g.73283 Transcript_26209/m.73283 type:complete len:210 (-) Transcript_26209:74-703(-)